MNRVILCVILSKIRHIFDYSCEKFLDLISFRVPYWKYFYSQRCCWGSRSPMFATEKLMILLTWNSHWTLWLNFTVKCIISYYMLFIRDIEIYTFWWNIVSLIIWRNATLMKCCPKKNTWNVYSKIPLCQRMFKHYIDNNFKLFGKNSKNFIGKSTNDIVRTFSVILL